MGFESVALYGKLAVDCALSGSTATLDFYTDLPGNAMASRKTATLTVTSGRVPVKVTLPAATKGRLCRVEIVPAAGAVMRLYGIRVWARILPRGDWQWYPVYVPPTGDEYVTVRVPVPPTPEEWATVPVPVPPTPADFATVAVPVPPTPPDFSTVPVPVPPTPGEYSTVRVPVPPSDELPRWREVPVDE